MLDCLFAIVYVLYYILMGLLAFKNLNKFMFRTNLLFHLDPKGDGQHARVRSKICAIEKHGFIIMVN